jgi:hypothetical protein
VAGLSGTPAWGPRCSVSRSRTRRRARARGEKTSRSDRRVSPCPFSLPSHSRAPRRYYRLLTTGLIHRRWWNDESTLRYAKGDERCPPVRRRRRAGAAASPPSRAELDHKGSAGLCPVADGVVSPGAGPRTSASACDSTWAVRVAGMGGVMWRGHHWSVAIRHSGELLHLGC